MTFAPAEAAERTGLSLDTLRYSEREGLVGPIERVGGRRRYSEDDLAWLGLLTCLHEAGLRIEDLRGFTELLRSQDPGEDRVAFLQRRRADLVDRIDRLHRAVAVLDGKIAHYGG